MEQQVFTEEFFIEFIRNELAKQYYRYPAVRSMFELEDLVQDTIMWYYQPMRNGEQRLAHYLKEYDLKHFCNHLRFSLQQTIPALMRYQFMKNIPLSLNVPLDDEDESTEFLDMISDENESYESQLQFDDTVSQIIKALREANRVRLYNEAKKVNSKLTSLEFNLNPSNIINLGYLIQDQVNLMTDLYNGYKSSELRTKYKNYDKLLSSIRTTISNYYETQGSTVKDILGVQEERLSRVA